MELRQRALHALTLTDPADKVAAVRALWVDASTLRVAPGPLDHPAGVPGRPARPTLLARVRTPQRSAHTVAGRAALVHTIAHIEFNAINLALDAIWRFADMPPAYYADWLRVAHEEAHHFSLLRTHLQSLEDGAQRWDYGDFPAHDGLWTMCERTAGDITARMALVPRTLEARGLDATPLIQAKLQRARAPDAQRAIDILDTILRDEVGHVAIGNHWYRWLCARDGHDPLQHYLALVARHCAPEPRPPFNLEARRRAGFTEAELAWLTDGGNQAAGGDLRDSRNA